MTEPSRSANRTIDAESRKALRADAERMVRNLLGTDRLTDADDTLALLDTIESLQAENEELRADLRMTRDALTKAYTEGVTVGIGPTPDHIKEWMNAPSNTASGEVHEA